jgi:hypothetical protein
MRSINQRKNKKPILLLFFAAIVLVGGGIAYLAIFRPFSTQQPAAIETRPANDVDYGPPSQQELQVADEQKDDILKAATDDQATNSDAGITVSIARVSQEGPGKPLNIRVQIDGTSHGNCQVTLTRQGQSTVNKTFAVVFEATSSMCQNADIPVGEFGESGEWSLSVVVQDGAHTSKPIVQSVMVVK